MKFDTNFGMVDVIRMIVFFFGILIFANTLYKYLPNGEKYRNYLNTQKGLITLVAGTVLYNLLMHINF
jgi:hypothetical protein